MEVNVAASCLNCFTSERAHSTHCMGNWASIAGLDTTAVSQTRISWATGLWLRHYAEVCNGSVIILLSVTAGYMYMNVNAPNQRQQVRNSV
jgi:hypothetical protein